MDLRVMYLGMCKIRSAGRTSGSIEVTLPPALHTFTGLGCRVVVRDGLRPEIVLQPDFADAWSVLGTLWEKLSLALGSSETRGDFAPGTFILTLLPPRHWQRGLPLAYADLYSVARSAQPSSIGDLEALARVLSAMGAAAGRDFGLQHAFALGFGEAVAYVVTQISTGFGTDFERSMAADLSRRAQFSPRAPVSPFDDEFWSECEPVLRRIYAQFVSWQANPAQYEAVRRRWYRAIQCENVPGRADQCATAYE